MPEPTFEELLDAMKTGAGALQRQEIPFVLGGGLAAWARGGPKSEHDVDFMIKPEDADAALDAMESAGSAPSARRRAGCTRRGTRTAR